MIIQISKNKIPENQKIDQNVLKIIENGAKKGKKWLFLSKNKKGRS
jgi:hypothetical protein